MTFGRLVARWRWLAWLTVLMLIVQVVVWSFDRELPYKVIAYPITRAKPGEHLQIEITVQRDYQDRACDLFMTRWMQNEKGFRFYLYPLYFSTADLRRLDRESPGKVKLSLWVPKAFDPGPAYYEATMLFRCNPIHAFWPLEMQQSIRYEVVE